jgi:hypothetical protein
VGQRRLRIRDEARQEALHLLVHRIVVHDDALGPRSGEVPDHPDRQGELGVKRGGGAHLLLADLDLVPDRGEVADIRLEVGLPGSLARGADDEPEILGSDARDRIPQAAPLAVGIDPAGHTHALGPGRQDQVTPGDGDVGGDPGPLGADRVLRHLHHDLLALGEQGVDLRLGAATVATVSPAAARPRLLLGVQLGERVGLIEIVAHVQEGGLLQTDVHEGRLHARQHPVHPPQGDRARDAAVGLAFDVELREVSLLENRHAGLTRIGVDENLVKSRYGAKTSRSGSPWPRISPPALASRSRERSSGARSRRALAGLHWIRLATKAFRTDGNSL